MSSNFHSNRLNVISELALFVNQNLLHIEIKIISPLDAIK